MWRRFLVGVFVGNMDEEEWENRQVNTKSVVLEIQFTLIVCLCFKNEKLCNKQQCYDHSCISVVCCVSIN